MSRSVEERRVVGLRERAAAGTPYNSVKMAIWHPYQVLPGWPGPGLSWGKRSIKGAILTYI